MIKTRRDLTFLVLALALLAVGSAPEVEAEERPLSARVDEPFTVDGKLFDAATVTLRFVGRYNPTSTLHEVRVGDECVGIFVAERVSGNSGGNLGSIILGRKRSGTLVLVGFRYRGTPPSQYFALRHSTADGHGFARTASRNDEGSIVAAGPVRRDP